MVLGVLVVLIAVVARVAGGAGGLLQPRRTSATPCRRILEGLKLTVILFLTAEPLILLIGLVLAVVRGLKAPIFTPFRLMAVAYADVVRGIPTILLILLFGFGIPALNLQGLPDRALFWAWLALVVSYSAYVSEVLRAGLESVHPSQRAAARALGLNQYQSLRFVVVPQAVRRVIPPLLNDFIALQKDTALVALVGAVEMFRAAQIEQALYFDFTAAGHRGLLLHPADRPALAVRRLDGRAAAPSQPSSRWCAVTSTRRCRCARFTRPSATMRCYVASASTSTSTRWSR